MVISIIICICAMIKASKICGDDFILHALLIFFFPIYALVFLIAGKNICKSPSRPRRTVSNNRR